MSLLPTQPLDKKQAWLVAGFLLLLSYFTVVHGFWNPPALFWDENYHIASAQKYLNGVFFMEPHPPLGKMMVALGEKLLHLNDADNQFINTDYAKDPPPGFSFAGYRLFPVLLAWLSVPILFAIFLLITRSSLWSMLLSFLYVFDNALIVHLRSAMLESTLLFFILLTILSFLLLLERKGQPRAFTRASLLFGVAFGGVMATKLNGLILLLLLPSLLVALWPRWKQWLRFLWIAGIGCAVVYIGVWWLHFSIASTVNSQLPDDGYYQASPQYKQLLMEGKTSSLFAFPTMLRDSEKFVGHYEQGVPRLDLCKADENGSPFFFWPLGARTINYRWETPDGYNYRYLYLQVNPVVWLAGLAGLFLSILLLLGPVFLPVSQKPKSHLLIVTFLVLYLGYMVAMSRLERVMYLYHYFVPLLFTFILLALVVVELERFAKWHLTQERKTSILLLLSTLIFLGFQFYRPLTYYEPITDAAFKRRMIFQLWDLKCVHCETNSMLVIPRAS